MTAEALYLALFGRGLRLRADDDGRLIVSPGDRLTDDDRVKIRRHKDELLAIVAYAAIPSTQPDSEPAPNRTGQPVPSGCVGPTACQVLGACGRKTCGAIPDISQAATSAPDSAPEREAA